METVYEWFNAKQNKIKQKRTVYVYISIYYPVKNFHIFFYTLKSSWLQESPKLFVTDVDELDNPIVNKINNITFNLLRDNDSELYFYFVKNDISLAPFGM